MSNFFSDAVKSGYFMYMAEAEGKDNLVNTREAKINAIINDLRLLSRDELRGNPDYFLRKACRAHGLEDITQKEVAKIQIAINKGR